MKIHYAKVGICGLSCRLCPMYQTQSKSRCTGCKSPDRIKVGCPFITCALKKKEVEFCWQCPESSVCEKWNKHRELGKQYDSFKCYQKLEQDILFIREHGIEEFEKQQKIREQFLKELLQDFNDGRSKSYYCIVATVLETDELQFVLARAKEQTRGLQPKEKAKVMHSLLEEFSDKKGYLLKLRNK